MKRGCDDIRVNNYYPFRQACRNGHIDVAKYLLDDDSTINIFSTENDLSSEDFYAYSRACKNGHLNVAYLATRISRTERY